MVNRMRWIAFIVPLVLLLTGCWDRVEIEQRGFVVGIAVDTKKNENSNPLAAQDVSVKQSGGSRFIITYQFVIPKGMEKGGGGSGAGGGQTSSGGSAMNISSEGNTMLQATREMVTRTSRMPYLEHMEMIVLSESLSREGRFGHVLDYYLRENETRRSTRIFVADDARKILEAHPGTEMLTALHIEAIARNVRKSGTILPEARIGDVHERLLKNESFAIPRLRTEGKEIKDDGAAVFHGKTNEMVGYLDEVETEALNYVRGKIKGDVIEIKYNEDRIVFETFQEKRKIKVQAKDPERLEFTILLRLEGNIGESLADVNFQDPAVISEIREKAAEEIRKRCEKMIAKVQGQYKTDVLGLGEYMRQMHPGVWKQLGPDWEYGRNYFSKCVIRVETEVKIREVGAILKSEKR